MFEEDNNLHPGAHHAYVAINYDRLGEFGELLEHLFLLLFFALLLLIFMLLKQTILGMTSQTTRGTNFMLENSSSGSSMASPTPS